MSTELEQRSDVGLVHEALPYRQDREYCDGAWSFVHAAVAANKPVLVQVPGRLVDLLRDALGADAALVSFGDMTQDGRNPGRIIPAVLRRFVDTHPGRWVAIIGEPQWPERSYHAYTAVVQHEALINLAFVDDDADILCPYNLAELPERALTDAERTHPALRRHGARVANANCADPRAVVESIYDQLPSPPADAEPFEFTVVGDARKLVQDWAVAAGLSASRVTDLEIAISEIGGNSVVHGDGSATLFRWTEDNGLVCEIHDQGHIDDLLVGRRPPPTMSESGRGLLMVNYLCDLVQLKTGPSGTAIRIWMSLSPP